MFKEVIDAKHVFKEVIDAKHVLKEARHVFTPAYVSADSLSMSMCLLHESVSISVCAPA